MSATIFLAGLCGLLSALVLGLWLNGLRTERQLAVLVALTSTQVFVGPLATMGLSLATVVALLLIPSAWRVRRDLLTHYYGQALLALLAVRGVYASYSSQIDIGARAVMELLVYAIALTFASHLLRCKGAAGLRAAAWVVVGLGLAVAISVILFRVLPIVESLYLNSPLASVLIGSNTTEALAEGLIKNNVLDPSKAAGLLYINANSAVPLLLGAAAVGMVFLGGRFASTASCAALAALFFTGSKYGVFAALVFICVAIVFFVTRHFGREGRDLTTLTMLGLGLVSAGPLVNTALAEDASFTLGTRQQIWDFALYHLLQRWILGDGYGGWVDVVNSQGWLFGVAPNTPPHNSYLQAWSETGLAGLLLTVGGAALLLTACVATLGRRAAMWRWLPAATLILVVVQSLGENFPYYGESRATAVLAMLAAVVVSQPEVAGGGADGWAVAGAKVIGAEKTCGDGRANTSTPAMIGAAFTSDSLTAIRASPTSNTAKEPRCPG